MKEKFLKCLIWVRCVMSTKFDKKQVLKRSADWFEKISVASIAVGLFQDGAGKTLSGLAVGAVSILISHYCDKEWRKL